MKLGVLDRVSSYLLNEPKMVEFLTRFEVVMSHSLIRYLVKKRVNSSYIILVRCSHTRYIFPIMGGCAPIMYVLSI